jgi:hypothetical protein
MKLTTRGKNLLALAGVALAMAVYLFLQARCFQCGTNEKDCEGYFILGKRLAAGEPAGRPATTPFQQINHVWVENDRGELLPKYAPGYPLLVGAAYRFSGGSDAAAFAVNPVLGLVALAGAWVLFRLFLGLLPSVLGVWLLMLHPMFQSYSSYPLAHAMELACLVWGFAFLGRWARRPGFAAALGAGFAFGCAAGARHTAILYALPVATVATATAVREIRNRRAGGASRPAAVWGSLLALGAAYAVVPALVALYHWRWFGSPFHSGYYLTGEQQALKWAYVWENIETVIVGLNHDCGLALFALALAGMVLAGPRLFRIVCIEWLLVACVPYLFYYWAPRSIAFFRFYYPVVPMLIGSALMALEEMLRGRRHRRALLCAYAAVVVLSWCPKVLEPFLGWTMSAAGRSQAAVGAAVRPHLREDAVLFLEYPLDTGIGAFQRYDTYRIQAFDRWILREEMKPWKEPWERTERERWNRWPIMSQDSRRLKLESLFEELGPEGLVRRHVAFANERLAASNQVAYLLRTDDNPYGHARLPQPCGFTLEPLARFDVPGHGSWTLYEADATTP